MANHGKPSTSDNFKEALSAILKQGAGVTPGNGELSVRSMAIAYSGGLDSTALLHLAHDFAHQHKSVLHAFHIHHGLSALADDWLTHCAAEAKKIGIAFDSRHITVAADSGEGLESMARTGRYAALGALCREHGISVLLTGHHQNDQAETVLLQLLRGSGVAGLSGMERCNHAPTLLGDATCLMGRPMLGIARTALEAFARERGFSYVDDPSNLDPRYARNALRHQVMPVIEAAFPGFAERFARSAHHAQSAQQLLVEFAQQDFSYCIDGVGIALDRLRSLSTIRCDNLLRYWFGSRGMRMPSSAWLQEMREQVLNAKPDAQVLIGHADCEIHRHRNRIVMTARTSLPDAEQAAQLFVWRGEAAIHFPAYGGTLFFEAGMPGIDAAWLGQQALAVQWRSGGWRLRLAANRSTRSLKYHYQAADVPAWERARLPLVTVGKQLLFAAGIGMDCHHYAPSGQGGIMLRWQADHL